MLFSGELTSEDVLQWLIQQKTEDRIETVTRSMLESLLVNVQYLAVYFCKLFTRFNLYVDRIKL